MVLQAHVAVAAHYYIPVGYQGLRLEGPDSVMCGNTYVLYFILDLRCFITDLDQT